MIDWQLAILRIKRVFHLTDEELALKVGCGWQQISDLKRGRVQQPKYDVGVELKQLWEKADGRTGKEADKLGALSEGQG